MMRPSVVGPLLMVSPPALIVCLSLLPPLAYHALLNALLTDPAATTGGGWMRWAALMVGHCVALAGSEWYLALFKWLSWPARQLFTVVLLRFLHVLLVLTKAHNMFADLRGCTTVQEFYARRSRSTRRRMLQTIPRNARDRFGVEVQTKSSLMCGWKHVWIQGQHVARVAGGKWRDTFLMACSTLMLVGTVTEFWGVRPPPASGAESGDQKGKGMQKELLAWSISFIVGKTYVVFMYGATKDASQMGLWFLNLRIQLDRAIRSGCDFLNGTHGHKDDAKRNAGLEECTDAEINDLAYGGPGDFQHWATEVPASVQWVTGLEAATGDDNSGGQPPKTQTQTQTKTKRAVTKDKQA